ATPALERLEPLFGPAGSTSDAPPPATTLRLTLLGSFVHADPSRSSAIIQREGSKPRRYSIGDELDNGIYLHAVYRDRVELKRQGRLESLPFPAKRISGIAPSSQAETPTGSALEQLSELHNEDAALLRERMDALRQQMEAAGSLPAAEPPEPPMESD
ncbi:MAG: type II secretion system protein N, partial [Pseudomonas sp.]